MKRIIIFFLLIVFSATSFGQQTNQSIAMGQTDWLTKSKRQKKTALILLGTGGALILAGAIIPAGELTDQFDPYTLSKDIHKNDGIKAALMLGGGLSMLGSIPLFIISNHNKRKASVSTSFKMEKQQMLQHAGFVYKSYPAITLKINL
jgi:hypothetical protein